jgi:hypothetical protein
LIISVLEHSNIKMIRDIWHNSRPQAGLTSIEDIIAIDAPVNEFPSITMLITSTILEREVIATLRDHVMWAQGTRVEDPTQWIVSDEIYACDPSGFDDLRDEMKRLRNSQRQDDYRLLTPVLSATTYSVRLSLRSLVKLSRFFNECTMTDRAVERIFKEASHALWCVIDNWVGQNISGCVASYAPINLAQEPRHDVAGSLGDFTVISRVVPFSLRTHMIRHRSLSVVSNLSSFMTRCGITATIGQPIRVQVCGSYSTWSDLATKRRCWMAHFGLWKGILDQAVAIIGCGDGELPCSYIDKCPYPADAQLRYTDADPGLPCPIHATLTRTRVDWETRKRMRLMVEEDERPNWWYEEIKKLENS